MLGFLVSVLSTVRPATRSRFGLLLGIAVPPTARRSISSFTWTTSRASKKPPPSPWNRASTARSDGRRGSRRARVGRVRGGRPLRRAVVSGAAHCVATGDTSATFPAGAGHGYYLLVDAALGAGDFTLELVCDWPARNASSQGRRKQGRRRQARRGTGRVRGAGKERCVRNPSRINRSVAGSLACRDAARVRRRPPQQADCFRRPCQPSTRHPLRIPDPGSRLPGPRRRAPGQRCRRRPPQPRLHPLPQGAGSRVDGRRQHPPCRRKRACTGSFASPHRRAARTLPTVTFDTGVSAIAGSSRAHQAAQRTREIRSDRPPPRARARGGARSGRSVRSGTVPASSWLRRRPSSPDTTRPGRSGRERDPCARTRWAEIGTERKEKMGFLRADVLSRRFETVVLVRLVADVATDGSVGAQHAAIVGSAAVPSRSRPEVAGRMMPKQFAYMCGPEAAVASRAVHRGPFPPYGVGDLDGRRRSAPSCRRCGSHGGRQAFAEPARLRRRALLRPRQPERGLPTLHVQVDSSLEHA